MSKGRSRVENAVLPILWFTMASSCCARLLPRFRFSFTHTWQQLSILQRNARSRKLLMSMEFLSFEKSLRLLEE